MYQNANGTITFYFGSHKDALDFVNIVKNANWDDYKIKKLEEKKANFKGEITPKQEKRWLRNINEEIDLFKAFEIYDSEEKLKDEDCVEVSLSFDYDFEIEVDGGYYPATMLEPAEYPTLEGVKDDADIRDIIRNYTKALEVNNLISDYDNEIYNFFDLDSEEKIWERYEEEMDYNPWEDSYESYDDY